MIKLMVHKLISVYNILYKNPTGPKPLGIRFDKMDGFITSLDGKFKFSILFDYGLFNEICDKFKYLKSNKNCFTNSIIILIKSVVNKYENNYYYNIFLEQGS